VNEYHIILGAQFFARNTGQHPFGKGVTRTQGR
jgi:hypothetical protein